VSSILVLVVIAGVSLVVSRVASAALTATGLPGDWIAGHTLGELRLRDEGVLVLGVVRTDGQYLGAPGKETEIHAGDQLVRYGHDDTLAELDCRTDGAAGKASHDRAAAIHRQRFNQETAADEADSA